MVVFPIAIAVVCAALTIVQTLRVKRYEKTARSADAPGADADADDEEASNSEAAVLANVAHELRTPLTSIIGYMKMLRRRADAITDEQRDDFLAICDRLAQRQLRLIESLLESSRLEEGATLRRERLDLQAIVLATVEGLGGVVSGHSVAVDVPDHDLKLYGSPGAVEHALSNLIENASKYAPRRTKISVRVREVGEDVLVAVSDEGPGIPETELPHVFDRGRRGPHETAPRGAGLGLSIVRSIVAAHGGRVWAESSGRGATITFTLPRRASDAAAAAVQDAEALRHDAVIRDAMRVMRVVR